MSSKDFKIVFGIMVCLIISRIVPHAPNFTAAIAGLLLGAVVIRHSLGLVLILLSYMMADLGINYFKYGTIGVSTEQFYWIYFPLAIIYYLNRMMTENSQSPLKIQGLGILSSLFFFLFSNIGVWGSSTMYSKDVSGLLQCFTLALPFLANEMAGTFFYSLVLFTVYWSYNKVEDLSYAYGRR
ncbi:MAG: hypothetical protein IPO62_12755 [Saprospiraceae bacterium]|nr:hypothetical protein [Saprospiraceae bacterium]